MNRQDTLELPDVAEALQAEVARLKEEDGEVDLETHSIYLNYWSSKIEGAARESVRVNDEVEMVNDDGFSNKKCPLTSIPVIDLDDPVRNRDCKHIYSKAAILSHLGRRSSLPCPQAGCRHSVSKRTIVDDPKLKEDIEFARESQRPGLESQRNQREFMDLADEEEGFE